MGENPAMPSEQEFEEARAQFPVLDRTAYLNAGSMGPLARTTGEAMRAEVDRDVLDGRSGTRYIERMLELRAELRRRLGALVSAEPEQVALTGSTTDGCNIVLAALDLGPDDEVVTTTDEHFGLIGPAHASGARVVVVPPDADRIGEAVTARTRLVAVSQVLWTTWQLLPVRELRERTGLPILVDGAQSGGAFGGAAEMAGRFRAGLGEERVDVIVPEQRATLVSWRVLDEARADVVARLAAAEVVVRDLPGTDLARASVGWWTSDQDLDRLVDGL